MNVILIGGVSGSGKTTLASRIEARVDNSRGRTLLLSTDDRFMVNVAGETVYQFDPTKLGQYHTETQTTFAKEIQAQRYTNIIVHNTFTLPWQTQIYTAIAGTKARVTILLLVPYTVRGVLASHARNKHGVPLPTVFQQAADLLAVEWEQVIHIRQSIDTGAETGLDDLVDLVLKRIL